MSARRPLALALLLGLALLTGCVTAPPAEPSEPSTSPAGPVFLVHGIWPDSVSWWIDEVQEELHARGIQTLPAGYTTFVFGYLSGLGTDGVADRVAATEHALRRRHASTGCEAELRLFGLGFSAGTAVLGKAAERGARFERLYFAGSPIPAWADWLEQQLREGRIERLVNYYSLLDGVTGALAGCGTLGFHAEGPLATKVENRHHWRPHWLPFWDDEDYVREVVDEIVASARGGRPHRCFSQPAFQAWFLEAKRRLRAGEDPPPLAWRAPRTVARSE